MIFVIRAVNCLEILLGNNLSSGTLISACSLAGPYDLPPGMHAALLLRPVGLLLSIHVHCIVVDSWECLPALYSFSLLGRPTRPHRTTRLLFSKRRNQMSLISEIITTGHPAYFRTLLNYHTPQHTLRSSITSIFCSSRGFLLSLLKRSVTLTAS